MIDDTRLRFLKSIAAQLDVERIAEVHLFPAIRQGGMESGVAVLALDPVRELASVAATDEVEEVVAADDADEAEDADSIEPETDDEADARPTPRRFTVYTARYRHTLKGPDRGKWEVSVTEEADAPLLTVDAVVRGVQRRSGEVDEIVRMSGGEIAAMVQRE